MKKIRFALSLLLLAFLMLVGCEKVSYEWVTYHDDQEGNVYQI